ncbi:MAG: hypothetical protein KBA31_11785 [Alphaproteobacteria bacterium]|nr:hypothetical protein [Alphaproteobacteria bacterium]
MSSRLEEEERARTWLRERGYETDRPTWLSGDNPDFWAHGIDASPPGLWVEVKSADKSGTMAALDKHYDMIHAWPIPDGLRGHSTFHLSPTTTKESVERLLKRFVLEVPKYAERECALNFVQHVGNKRDLQRIEIHGAVPETFWVFGAGGAKPSVPLGSADTSLAPATWIGSDGERKDGRAFNFLEWSTDPDCALVVRITPRGLPFGIGLMSGGHVAAREKTLPMLKRANSQIKAACVDRDVPGIVVLVPQDWHVEPMHVQAACYGVLQVPISVGRDVPPSTGQMYHGHDGMFRPDKNTHLSAVLLLSQSGAATFFPNPFALHTIPDTATVFRGAKRAAVDLGNSS